MQKNAPKKSGRGAGAQSLAAGGFICTPETVCRFEYNGYLCHCIGLRNENFSIPAEAETSPLFLSESRFVDNIAPR